MITTSHTGARSTFAIPAVFTATIFLSAGLLFFVQPLFARIVLPHIGGAPAVWTTAMLFFQTVLIGGYLYAHLSTRYLPVRGQLILHLSLWAAALFFLPLGVAAGWRYDGQGSAAFQTLILFAAGVGMPFFVLSANAPLIQSWYARTSGPSADDPYFLYGASNLGSLLALLAFPLLAEPLFGATAIGQGWAIGFIALGGCLLISGLLAEPGARGHGQTVRADWPPVERLVYWALLAFVPSSLMLAVTSKVATDFGSIPLIWIVPLALYLLTFVLTFSHRAGVLDAWLKRGFLLSVPVLALIFSGILDDHLTWGAVAALTLGYLATALFAHRKLYLSRPEGAQLTQFYVTMSIGGAMGGLFNSILAPALFTRLTEGPVTVALAALILAGGTATMTAGLPRRRLLLGVATTVVAVTAISWAQSGPGGGSLFRDRSFFGTHDVQDQADLRVYLNGTTMHGAQRVSDPASARPTPLLYYHPMAPMAQILTSETGKNASSVGVVGLGVGALACYAQPGQDWHFYEIDATVDRVARDPSLFSFLSSCTPDAPTHLGDARMVLQQQDLGFDILVIDAYSSDAVPVHLTTTEAMEIYLDRLNPGGILIYHISNRYFDIKRPLGRSAAALGLYARLQNYAGTPGDAANPSSRVVMIARDPADFGPLANDARWHPLGSDGGPLWTDDHANLLSILR